LRQLVIARRRLEAAGAPGGSALVRLDGDFQATGLAVAMALQPDVAINKSGKIVTDHFKTSQSRSNQNQPLWGAFFISFLIFQSRDFFKKFRRQLQRIRLSNHA
jgi:hypothetical protein